MRAATIGDRSRWIISAGISAVVLAGFLFLFRWPRLPETAPARPAATPSEPSKQVVQLAKPVAGDAVLTEMMILGDLRPLFLPTKWNASLPEPRLEPGRSFLDAETPKLSFGEGELNLGRELLPGASMNSVQVEDARPLDVLMSDPQGPILAGFGRNKQPIEPLDPRGGFLEVIATATGVRMLAARLGEEARVPVDKHWQPLELLAVIDRGGLAAPLVVAEGSGVDEIDSHFKNYLVRRFRIGERLPPGFYRIVIAP